MTTAHVFIATSLDGFIARPDGDIGWLLQRDAAGEDHGFDAFIADKDAVVMGRETYEKVLGFPDWPFALPVHVMTSRPAGPRPPGLGEDRLRFSALAPRDLLQALSAAGTRRVYLDGGRLIQSFLREGLVEDLVLTTVPVLLGSGRPLFGALARDVDLRLVASRSFPSGLVQSTYRVMR